MLHWEAVLSKVFGFIHNTVQSQRFKRPIAQCSLGVANMPLDYLDEEQAEAWFSSIFQLQRPSKHPTHLMFNDVHHFYTQMIGRYRLHLGETSVSVLMSQGEHQSFMLIWALWCDWFLTRRIYAERCRPVFCLLSVAASCVRVFLPVEGPFCSTWLAKSRVLGSWAGQQGQSPHQGLISQENILSWHFLRKQKFLHVFATLYIHLWLTLSINSISSSLFPALEVFSFSRPSGASSTVLRDLCPAFAAQSLKALWGSNRASNHWTIGLDMFSNCLTTV